MKPYHLLLALSMLLGGCAFLFRSTQPRALLDAPSAVQALDANGHSLPVQSEGTESYIYPPNGSDFITLVYRGHTQNVELAKHISGWVLLDLVAPGAGLVLDDATGSWFNYNAIHVRADTGSSSALVVTSTNWLGEPAGRRRPELIVLGGAEPIIHPLMPFPIPFFLMFQIEGGIGIDLFRKLDLLWMTSNYPAFDLVPGEAYSPWADITSNAVVSRLFYTHDLYGQVSFGYGRARHYSPAAVYSNQFPIVGAGVGWSGEISYIRLEFRTALKPFQIESYSPLYYREITLDMGLNLRF